jgi:hypothetical protein
MTPWLKRLSSPAAIGLGSLISLVNYYFLTVFAGISYDIYVMRTSPPDRPAAGGPASMVAFFMLGPLVAVILAPVTYLILNRLRRRGRDRVVGAIVLAHACISLAIVALFLFAESDGIAETQQLHP